MKNSFALQKSEIVLCDKGDIYTTSFIIADLYNKLHKNVLRDIRELVAKHESLSLNFKRQLYQHVMKDGGVVNRPFYTISKTGAIVMAFRYSSYRLSFDVFNTLIKSFEEKEQSISNASMVFTILNKENKELKEKLQKAELRLRDAEAFIGDADRLAVFTIKKLMKRSAMIPNESVTHSFPLVDHNVLYSAEKNNVTVNVVRTGMLTYALAQSLNMSIQGMKNILKVHGVFFSASYGMMYRCHDYMVKRGETIIRTTNGNTIRKQSWYWTPKGIEYVRKICKPSIGENSSRDTK